MKVFDCHVHVFPDKIAAKVVETLEEFYQIPFTQKGTLDELKEKVEKFEITKALIFSTATKPQQVETINTWITEVADFEKYIPFGSMHPDYENKITEIERIISLGCKGIKLHPDFQERKIDDPSMEEIYEICQDRLIVLLHVGDPRHSFSSPKRLLKMIEKYPRVQFIAAHLGGYLEWDAALEYIIGTPCFIDTSVALNFLSTEKATHIIKTHGTNKVLFGTDYPGMTYDQELPNFMRLQLTDQEKADILYHNAAKLLNV